MICLLIFKINRSIIMIRVINNYENIAYVAVSMLCVENC